MGEFNKPIARVSVDNSWLTAPKVCSVSGCEKDTHLAFFKVSDGRKTITGSPGDFILSRGDEKKLKDGYTIVRWIARCADCYCADLLGANKNQIKDEAKIISDRKKSGNYGLGVGGKAARMLLAEQIQKIAEKEVTHA